MYVGTCVCTRKRARVCVCVCACEPPPLASYLRDISQHPLAAVHRARLTSAATHRSSSARARGRRVGTLFLHGSFSRRIASPRRRRTYGQRHYPSLPLRFNNNSSLEKRVRTLQKSGLRGVERGRVCPHVHVVLCRFFDFYHNHHIVIITVIIICVVCTREPYSCRI